MIAGGLLTAALGAQQAGNLVRPKIAGQVIASQFGAWSAQAQGNGQAGMQTVTILSGPMTLPDGTAWMPLQAGTPLLTGGDGSPEVVVPTAVNCPVQGPACTLTATFGLSHQRFTLASATAGLQEAVNFAGPGGAVLDDVPVATLHAPLVLAATVRLSGQSAFDANVGSQIVQAAANTDTIQIGTASASANDVVLEHILVAGVKGDGSDSGVAIHCVNCVGLKLNDVVGKNAHDGLFLDSANGHAYDATVTGSHLIGNYYGVHLVGGSANRDTFVGNTVDANVYGVFDDGGWVHTWVGNDIESNTQYGYWQQISNPAQWSGHNVVLQGNYFERNGAAAGQGDVFLGQLLGGGSGNNGAGCVNCEISDNLFNATNGSVTALSFGSVQGSVANNTYSGYSAGNQYAYVSGPSPNFSEILALGDCGVVGGSGCAAAAPGTITRLDSNGTLTIGGTDQLTDPFGTRLHDTTIESPTGAVSLRGHAGGLQPINPSLLQLDGNSSTMKASEIKWRNQGVDEWGIKNDVASANAHDFCLANDYANPSLATCDLYVNQQKHFNFSGTGVPGNITFDADYRFHQQANGDPGVQIMRFTDTAPTGYLLDLEDATESHPLFRVDASGNVSAQGTINVAGGATFQSAAALAAGSTMGGLAISTSPNVIGATSGVLFASSSLSAGQCVSGGVSFGSGVAVGMAVAATPLAAPPAGLVWSALIDTANHVTLQLCNATASTVAWSAGSTWAVRILP